ncbi:MAG: SDR family NAD(P)-dependent oxidoreductase [Saprospiraceae bacterium]|nr:SDR family NAD(P)-dependent oxidoreductase [Saprospiraceae bacterium]
MANNNIALAYCIDNIHRAEYIESALKPAGYTFSHHYCKQRRSEASIAEQVQDIERPILLLISDNFIKSSQCMDGALEMLQRQNEQILTVVIDGVKKDEETGETIAVPTEFDRVSEIIQYMSYWQDRYLDLRKQKKELDAADEEPFQRHLKKVRQISNDVGEFLRLLRNSYHLSYEEFSADHFREFFQLMGDEEGWEKFKGQSLTEESETGKEVEEIASPEEIPGMDQLEGKENIERIVVHKQINGEPEEDEDLADAEGDRGADEPAEETAEQPAAEADEQEDLIEDFPQDAADLASEDTAEIAFDETETEEEEIGRIIVADEFDESEASQEVEWEIDSEDLSEEEPEEEEPLEIDLSDSEFEEEEEEEEELDEQPSAPPLVDREELKGFIDQAREYVSSGQIEEGVSFVRTALEKYPESNQLRYYLGILLAQDSNNIQEAAHEIAIILEREPTNLRANFLMGELSELKNDFHQARQHYEKVMDLAPDYPGIYYRLAIVLANHFPEEAKRAGKYFKKAIKRNPKNADAHYQYGLLLSDELDKPKKAIKQLKKTLDIDEDHPFAHYDLALIYHRLGKQKKAHKAYLKAIENNPELKTPENDLAFAYEKEIRELEPVEETEQPLASSPESDSGSGIVEEEYHTLEAIKENIRHLQNLLEKREQEIRKREESERDIAEPVGLGAEEKPVVFISGATSGIGRATAEVFAREGYRLILNGRREDRLEDLRQKYEEEFDADVQLLPFDVRSFESIRRALDTLDDEWREIDILINNAGKAKGLAPINEGQIDHWEEMIDTNIKGLLFLTRLVTPQMVARRKGHIINIASTAGKEVYPQGNVYCATKHAVEALTKAMRLDLYKHDIKVSQVSPAHVEETEFALVRFDGDASRAQIYDDFQPLKATDVAEAILFIATRPRHVNVQDVLMMGTQQASSLFIHRSGRDALYEEE